MAALTNISVNPTTIVKGSKAVVTPGISNQDRTQTVHGIDENGTPVTASYTVHENLTLQVVALSSLPAKAAPGTMVFATDSTVDVLSVDAANPLTLDLQTN